MNKIPHRYFPNTQIKVNPMKMDKKKIVLQGKIAVICHHKNCSYKWTIDNCFFIFHVGYVLLHKKGIVGLKLKFLLNKEFLQEYCV